MKIEDELNLQRTWSIILLGQRISDTFGNLAIQQEIKTSDERGDRKRRKLLGYTHFWFLYIHICRGKLELQKKSSLAGGVFNFKKLTKDYTKTLLL